jgi:hypothetical protein
MSYCLSEANCTMHLRRTSYKVERREEKQARGAGLQRSCERRLGNSEIATRR